MSSSPLGAPSDGGENPRGGGRRSVRLRRGFVNVERAPFGGEKLRIPSLLFVEKMRTQSRFNVGTPGVIGRRALPLY